MADEFLFYNGFCFEACHLKICRAQDLNGFQPILNIKQSFDCRVDLEVVKHVLMQTTCTMFCGFHFVHLV
jgi:hypothetical protein